MRSFAAVVCALAALGAGAAAVQGGARPPAPAGLAISGARVTPRHAYVGGAPVAISFTVAAPAPAALEVDVVGEKSGEPVRRFTPPAVAGGAVTLNWDGLTGGGAVAPGGGYRVRVRAAGGAPGSGRNVGRVTLRSHIYPIRGRHADRGAGGAFGVPRSGGRVHQGFDVFSPCGTAVVAARGGLVRRVVYDPVLYGWLVVIRGIHTHRDYWYAHLLGRPRVRAGQRVRTGARIGSVGATGNARTIGCQLHFELRPRGVPVDPAPELHAWDAWS